MWLALRPWVLPWTWIEMGVAPMGSQTGCETLEMRGFRG